MAKGSFFYGEADESVFTEIAARRTLLSTDFQKAVHHQGIFTKIYSYPNIGVPDFKATIFESSAGGDSYESIYMTASGKPSRNLLKLKVTNEGSAGSLRRAEGNFLCYDLEQFQYLEKHLLRPGTKITIEYGFQGAEAKAQKSPVLNFTVYDFSFILNTTGNIEVTFKALGKGQELLEANAFNTSHYQEDKIRSFVADYRSTNEMKPVSSLFDMLDWSVQNTVGALDSKGFNPKMNSGWMDKDRTGNYEGQSRTSIDFVIMEAPNDYDSPAAQKVGYMVNDRLTYYSINYLAWICNRYVTKNEESSIICDGNVTKGDPNIFVRKSAGIYNWQDPGTSALIPIMSADPLSIMVVSDSWYDNYADGTDRTDGDNLRFDLLDRKADASIVSGDFSRILVARDLLVALSQKYRSTDSSGTENSKVTIKEFFADIFATIEDCTGGAVKLYLHQNPDPLKPNELLVKNGNEPHASAPTAVIFNPLVDENGIGDGISKSIKMTGKVPKGQAAESFGATPGGSPPPPFSEEKQETADEKALQAGLDVITRLDQAHKNLAYNDFDSTSISALKSVLQEMVQGEPQSQAAKTKSIPYPLEMECMIHGIYGFKFGDTISSDHLPSMYKQSSGLRVAFTVTRITDIIENNMWTTELGTVCRIVN